MVNKTENPRLIRPFWTQFRPVRAGFEPKASLLLLGLGPGGTTGTTHRPPSLDGKERTIEPRTLLSQVDSVFYSFSMASYSPIEWTEATWNPVTGCTKISQGCKNCYAEKLALRLQAMRQSNYRDGFKVTLQPHMLILPSRWRKPKRVFVNSMSDLFHDEVPIEYIRQVFDVMAQAHQHQFQLLTKRAERLAVVAKDLVWPSNVWMGVSVEDASQFERIGYLRRVPSVVRFLSVEPLLGPVSDLDLSDIHWVIVGGESGIGARPMRSEWALEVRDACQSMGVPFFFKQWGGVSKKKAGRLLEGQTYDEFPRVNS
jgi:protein gp37